MAEGANQHYVPQFYFRYFSKDGKSINVLLRGTGHTIANASIKGQASKKYFYGDSETESRLQKIDGLYAQVVNQVRCAPSFEDCGDDVCLAFLQNLMLQHSRTLAARISSKPMMDRLLQLQMEIMLNNDKNLPEEERQQLLSAVPHMNANPKQYQNRQMATAVDVAGALLDLMPIMLENRTSRPFIFSDAPVVFINLLCRNVKLRGVLGADTPGLMVFYPLGPTHLLILIDGQAYRVKGKTHPSKSIRELRDVAAINKLQIHNASNAIYFSDMAHAAYVQDLWNQERLQLRGHAGKVVEAPGFDHNGKPIGDIMHSFQPQIPFIPNLSFLQYSAVDEQDYVFSRRRQFT